MRIFVLLLLVCSVLVGQPTVGTPLADAITTTNVRVSWVTSANAYRTLMTGTATGVYTKFQVPEFFAPSTIHQMNMPGLAAGTTHFARVCNGNSPVTGTFTVNTGTDTLTYTGYTPTNGDTVMLHVGTSATYTALGVRNMGIYTVTSASGATSTLDDPEIVGTAVVDFTANTGTRNVTLAACSAEFSFTTTAYSGTVAQLPTAPDISANQVTPPTITGTTYTVNLNAGTVGCQGSTNEAALAACITTVKALANANNHQMRLTPGNYYGSQIFDVKTGTGWVQVRSDAADSALPPVGVQMSDHFRDNSSAAVIINDILPTGIVAGLTTLDDSTTACRGADDFVATNTANQVKSPVFKCTSAGLATDTSTITATAGSDASITVDTSDAHNCQDNGGIAKFTISGDTVLGGRTLTVSVVSSTRVQVHGASGTPNFGAGTGTIQCNTNMVPYGTYSADALPADGDSCTTEGEMKINTTSPLSNIRWCVPGPAYDYDPTLTWDTAVSSFVWRRFQAINGSATAGDMEVGGTCVTANCTSKWYFGPGIIVRHQRVPRLAGWRQSPQTQGKLGNILTVHPTTQDITFDRMDFISYEYPNRVGTMIQPAGSRISFIESRVYKGSAWTDPANSATSGTADSSTMIQGIQGEKHYWRNSKFSSAGISIFYPDSAQFSGNMSGTGDKPDITRIPVNGIKVERNFFTKDIEGWQVGRATQLSRNRVHGNRHHFECKHCEYLEFTNNILENSYSATTQGSPFLMTPVGPSDYDTATITSILDGVITYTGNEDGDFWRGRADQPYLTTEGMLVAVTGTDNAAHNLKVYELQDVNGTANTMQVVSGLAGSSTGGTVTLMTNDIRTAHVSFKWNTVYNSAYGVLMNGHNIISSDSAVEGITRQGGPYEVSNNLFFNINKRKCRSDTNYAACTDPDFGFNSACSTLTCNNGIDFAGGSVTFASFSHGAQHFTVNKNTLIDFRSDSTQNWIIDQSNAFNNFQRYLNVRDNLVMSYGTTQSPTTPDRIITLNEASDGNTAIAAWSVTHFLKNVYCCGLSAGYSGLFTGNNEIILPAAVADIKFQRYVAKADALNEIVYRLKYDSPYKNAGTDGGDIGVDIIELEDRQGKVRNVRLRRVDATSAIISYNTKVGDVCTTEVSTSATWGTGSRFADDGTTYVRNVNLTLNSGTADNIRLMCPTEKYTATDTAPYTFTQVSR
jgi:hypothetical protein